MKKKTIICIALAIAITFFAVLAYANALTQSKAARRLYRADNVYEEIWNMVYSEKCGRKTVLTTSVSGTKIIYDYGVFESISIPGNDEHGRVSLFFYHNNMGQMELIIWPDDNDDANNPFFYSYNHQTNTLYGNREESYLIDTFLSQYYSWVGHDGKFTFEDPGDYTFIFAEYPFAHK